MRMIVSVVMDVGRSDNIARRAVYFLSAISRRYSFVAIRLSLFL